MHTIRSSARREAWKYYDGESRNYNPFARATRGSPRTVDDEEALRTVRTADTVPSQLETDRRTEAQEKYSHPDRAGTAPQPNGHSHGHHHHHQPKTEQGIEASTPQTLVGSMGDIEKSETRMSEPIDTSTSTDATPRDRKSSASSSPNDSEHHKTGMRRRIMGKLGRSNTAATENSEMSESKKKKRKHIPFMKQFKAVFFGSWINILLLAVPVSFALNYAHVDGKIIFVVAFVAIVPLAATLSFATEELAMYVGETLGGLLNASFGNATELIVSIIALAQRKIVIVQTSLVGSMLSNLLLVLGMCFFGGGITRVKQHFNITVAQTACSLLALSIGSLIIPTAFQQFGSNVDNERTQNGIAPISRGTSVILLVVYGSYLFFQLKTHSGMYNEPSKKGVKYENSKKEKGAVFHGMAQMGAGSAAAAGGHVNQENLVRRPDEEEEEPTLSIMGGLITLGISTVLIAFCSEFMVTGIDAITGSGGISQEFVGLILLPIVGNAAEHATAVTVAIKDKMDLAIGVAVGSSQQIALLVLPLMVVIGWCGLGQPDDMTLVFDGFQIGVLFIAVLLVNYLIQDGESHWLEGVLLMATYLIIAVTAFFYPVDENATKGA